LLAMHSWQGSVASPSAASIRMNILQLLGAADQLPGRHRVWYYEEDPLPVRGDAGMPQHSPGAPVDLKLPRNDPEWTEALGAPGDADAASFD
jgi:hypothetical protein